MIITMGFAINKNSDKKLCVQIVTVILTCFSGFRTWWFGDLIKYYTLYRNCSGEDWKETVFESFDNIGIRLFFRGSSAVGLSYDVCIFIIAAFAAVTLGILIYRYSPIPYWSYLMYIAMGFYMFTFSGLKQTIAMGFICISFTYLVEGKFKKFLLWTLIGALFHAPALIFLVVYPISKKKIDWKYAVMILVTVAAIFIFKNQIIDLLSEAYYSEEGKFDASGSMVGGRVIMMVLIIIMGIIMRPIRSNDGIYCKVFNIMVMAAILQLFSAYDNVFTRLADYYYQFIVLFLPLVLEPGDRRIEADPSLAIEDVVFHDRTVYFCLSIVITAFALWYYDSYIKGSAVMLSDFKFFWEIDPYSLYGR